MRKLRKSVDSPKKGFESAKKDANGLAIQAIISILLMLSLIIFLKLKAKAQYQSHPISPLKLSFSTAPKYSPEDSAIIKNHSNQIISNHSIEKGSNTVICDLFLKDSRITSISKVGSYWRVKAQFRSYTDLYFFKASRYNLAWIRMGMRTEQSESKKRYVQSIYENKERIAALNEAIKDSMANENRSFISKIINPHE